MCSYLQACTVVLSCPVDLAYRLPKLSSVEFKIEGPLLPYMLHMAMLLLSLRTQLTSLQSLSLELSQSWVDAGLAFAELASMTQLTALSINMVADEVRAELISIALAVHMRHTQSHNV